jgi:hypothetical protein
MKYGFQTFDPEIAPNIVSERERDRQTDIA